MILECDLGNSCCKWRVLEKSIIVKSGVAFYPFNDQSNFPNVNITAIKVASVQSDDINDSLKKIFLAQYSLLPQWALVQSASAGVKCGYSQPECLGVDRWLGVVAAFNNFGASIVVDVGSAVTVDMVSEKGVHHGGYILPGAALMKKALFNDTKKVRFNQKANGSGINFGTCTQEAVESGITAAHIGVVVVAKMEADRMNKGKAELVMTGGGAKYLLPYLKGGFNFCPDLVLDGLRYVLP